MLVGADLGGTQLRVARVGEDGRVEAEISGPTGSSPAAVIEAALRAVEEVLRGAKEAPRAIGMGVTGPVDPRLGRVRNPYTLPGWHDVDLAGPVRERFGVPVFVENDAAAAALGEHWRGVGRGVRRFLCVTVGTGIGTGFLLDGDVVRGTDGAHPEAGHHVLDPSGPVCYCGAKGCWEQLASGTALARLAREASPGPGSPLHSRSDGDPDEITGKMVTAAAYEADPVALSAVARVGDNLGLGLVNCVAFFLPDVVALTGSVMDSYGLFEPGVRGALGRHSILLPATEVRVKRGALGRQAGVVGAARAAALRLSEG